MKLYIPHFKTSTAVIIHELLLCPLSYCHVTIKFKWSLNLWNNSPHTQRGQSEGVYYRPLCPPWYSLLLLLPQIGGCRPVQTCEWKQTMMVLTAFTVSHYLCPSLQIQTHALRVKDLWEGGSESKGYQHLGHPGFRHRNVVWGRTKATFLHLVLWHTVPCGRFSDPPARHSTSPPNSWS